MDDEEDGIGDVGDSDDEEEEEKEEEEEADAPGGGEVEVGAKREPSRELDEENVMLSRFVLSKDRPETFP